MTLKSSISKTLRAVLLGSILFAISLLLTVFTPGKNTAYARVVEDNSGITRCYTATSHYSVLGKKYYQVFRHCINRFGRHVVWSHVYP